MPQHNADIDVDAALWKRLDCNRKRLCQRAFSVRFARRSEVGNFLAHRSSTVVTMTELVVRYTRPMELLRKSPSSGAWPSKS